MSPVCATESVRSEALVGTMAGDLRFSPKLTRGFNRVPVSLAIQPAVSLRPLRMPACR